MKIYLTCRKKFFHICLQIQALLYFIKPIGLLVLFTNMSPISGRGDLRKIKEVKKKKIPP